MSPRFHVLLPLTALLAVAAPVRAAGPESVLLGAESAFSAASQLKFTPGFSSKNGFGQRPDLAVQGGTDAFDQFLKQHANVVGQAEQLSLLAAAPVLELDLAPLLNRHLKTSLAFTLGGKNLWVSGAFDKAQNAFVSILVEGAEALFYNVKGLLDKEETLVIGSATYKLSLAPNVIDQLESEIVLKNVANRKDRESVTIKEMLAAVSAAGADVKVAGQSYKAFYYDDIKDGRADKTNQAFAFILTDSKGEIHVFLVPSELVPSDKIAIFKMYENRRIGLTQADGKLKVFDNP